MLRAPWVVEAMRKRAERGAGYAEVLSPVRTGRYVGLIDVKPGGFHVLAGIRNGVAYAMYVNDTPYARFLEFGTRYMAAQKIMRRSIDGMRD